MDHINKALVPILNQSLTQGMFPQPINETIIHLPLVSSLPFLDKVIVKTEVDQLHVFLDNSSTLVPFNMASGWTNPQRLVLVDNLHLSIVKVHASLFLYLSATFVSVDHSTLLRHLEIEVHTRGCMFNWFKSFLTDRTQRLQSHILVGTVSVHF